MNEKASTKKTPRIRKRKPESTAAWARRELRTTFESMRKVKYEWQLHDAQCHVVAVYLEAVRWGVCREIVKLPPLQRINRGKSQVMPISYWAALAVAIDVENGQRQHFSIRSANEAARKHLAYTKAFGVPWKKHALAVTRYILANIREPKSE